MSGVSKIIPPRMSRISQISARPSSASTQMAPPSSPPKTVRVPSSRKSQDIRSTSPPLRRMTPVEPSPPLRRMTPSEPSPPLRRMTPSEPSPPLRRMTPVEPSRPPIRPVPTPGYMTDRSPIRPDYMPNQPVRIVNGKAIPIGPGVITKTRQPIRPVPTPGYMPNQPVRIVNGKAIPIGPGVVTKTRQPIVPVSPQKPISLDELERFQVNRSVQYNLYSDHAYFMPKSKQIAFENVASRSIVFEVRNPKHPVKRYTSKAFPTQLLIKDWNKFFPQNESNPNAVINGFTNDEDTERRILTLSLYNPVLNGNLLLFNYQLDTFKGDLNMDEHISKWDGKEPLTNISLMIDSSWYDTFTNLFKTYISDKLSSIKSYVFDVLTEIGVACTKEFINKIMQVTDLTYSQVVSACKDASYLIISQKIKDKTKSFDIFTESLAKTVKDETTS